MKTKKKNDFGMWFFSDGVMKTLNWIAVILIIVWFGYHGLRFVFGFQVKNNFKTIKIT